MGLREDLRQTARGTSESAKHLISSSKNRLKSIKSLKLRSPNRGSKRKSGFKETLRRNDPRVKAKVIKTKLSRIKRRINSGEATLDEKLKYRKLKVALNQLPVQAGIFAAQVGAAAVNPLLYPVGTVASVMAAGAASLSSGSDSANKRLVERVKAGKPLSPLERYKVRKANKVR